MNKKTETKLLEEILTEPLEEITDFYAKKWYKEGFRFAINWVHANLPETSERRLTKAAFATRLAEILRVGIDPNYFRDHPFNLSTGYPNGQCPGDAPGTCIQCADRAITPFP